MLGSLRFKASNVPRAARARKRGHYGGGVRSPAQRERRMNGDSSGIHLTFIPVG